MTTAYSQTSLSVEWKSQTQSWVVKSSLPASERVDWGDLSRFEKLDSGSFGYLYKATLTRNRRNNRVAGINEESEPPAGDHVEDECQVAVKECILSASAVSSSSAPEAARNADAARNAEKKTCATDVGGATGDVQARVLCVPANSELLLQREE
mmetsp:Transcript_5058/g.12794  ORF Transcript_5058/g.12794 Transcript_5058/m.12794 type:complete len:153 (-) Transcript_5058:1009-1467(-)